MGPREMDTTDHGTRGLELARAIAGPTVEVAGWFGPNTPGRWWTSWWSPDRQLLKADGTDLGARRLVAASATQLWVLRPWGSIVGRGVVARWHRHQIVARPVPSRHDPGLLGLELAERSTGRRVAEVRPLDEGAWALLTWLLRLPASSEPPRPDAGRADAGRLDR